MSWGWGSHDGINILMRERIGQSLLSSFVNENTVGRELHVSQEEGPYQLTELPGTLFFLAFWTVRNKFLLFEPLSLWYFVMEAWLGYSVYASACMCLCVCLVSLLHFGIKVIIISLDVKKLTHLQYFK